MANKKYTDFASATPSTDRLTLHADPATGELKSCTLAELLQLPIASEATKFMLSAGGLILAEPVGKSVTDITRQNSLSNQLMLITAIAIPRPMTVTGMLVFMTTQGNYTATNYNGVGLYKFNGTDSDLVASSTNDGNIWKATANTWIQKAFSGTYNADPGIYYATVLYCQSAQTTAPALGGMPLMQTSNLWNTILPANTAPWASKSSQTSLPDPLTYSGGINNTPYMALY